MRRSAPAFAPGGDAGWHLDDAPAEHVDRLTGGVVGFELIVDSVHCMEKLSQDKPADRARIRTALRAGTTAFGPLVAQRMECREE